MEELYQYRQTLLQRLEEIVGELRSAWGALPCEVWYQPLGEDERTPHQVIAHLRDIEAHALALRLRQILEQGEGSPIPMLALFDDGGWMASHYRPDEPPETILDEYARQRAEELTWLRELEAASWNLLCRHPWSGVHTLEWWVERSLAYAQEHLHELKSIGQTAASLNDYRTDER